MNSVLLAIYNVETYLPKCLDSVLGQTYSDLDIILVNDGSTDNSGIICEKYAEKDSRIKYIHQENEGLSNARNTGIRSASGEYILMMDGDDACSRRVSRCRIQLNYSDGKCEQYIKSSNELQQDL